MLRVPLRASGGGAPGAERAVVCAALRREPLTPFIDFSTAVKCGLALCGVELCAAAQRTVRIVSRETSCEHALLAVLMAQALLAFFVSLGGEALCSA